MMWEDPAGFRMFQVKIFPANPWFPGIFVQEFPQISDAFEPRQDYEVFPKKVLGEGCSGLVVMAKGRQDGRQLGSCGASRLSSHCIAKKFVLYLNV